MLQLMRIPLLVLLAVVFVAALGGFFVATTGVLEKAVCAAIAVLVALAVPRVRRFGSEKAASR